LVTDKEFKADSRKGSRCLSESGSITPLVVGVVLLVIVMTCAALATSEMAAERARQQNSADLGALAGANALSKATNTTRLIDGAIYARNVTLDVMYLAATVVSIASAGTGAEAFEAPAKFQEATEEPVAALEKSKTVIGETAVVYSIANGATIIKANGGDSGLALPLPLLTGFRDASQAQKDLEREVAVYNARIKISTGQMFDTMQAYKEKVAELKSAGLSDAEIQNRGEIDKLKHQVRESTGRVGGQTSQRNRHQKKLAALRKNSGVFAGGQTGVVAVVYHRSSAIPFTDPFGGLETGDNLAVAAARVEDGPSEATIGEEALANLFARAHLPDAVANGVDRMMESLNIAGGKLRGLKQDHGPLGAYLSDALDTLDLMPPSLTETRPALASVDSVLKDSSELYALAGQAIVMARGLEAKLGIDILPPDLER